MTVEAWYVYNTNTEKRMIMINKNYTEKIKYYNFFI
jgi:hypothetical protein